MHFEFLAEDASGKIALERLAPKILGPFGDPHTYSFHAYKGIGRIPPRLTSTINPRKRIMLDRLPQLLRGYGKSLGNESCVVIVVDSDKKDCKAFKNDLLGILLTCNPAPRTLIRIAIEELESWFLGDKTALQKAYPKSKTQVIDSYTQDSICGTWEKLADAVYPGGATELKKAGWPVIGNVKCTWAEMISEQMDVENNSSPSFNTFKDGIRSMAG